MPLKATLTVRLGSDYAEVWVDLATLAICQCRRTLNVVVVHDFFSTKLRFSVTHAESNPCSTDFSGDERIKANKLDFSRSFRRRRTRWRRGERRRGKMKVNIVENYLGKREFRGKKEPVAVHTDEIVHKITLLKESSLKWELSDPESYHYGLSSCQLFWKGKRDSLHCTTTGCASESVASRLLHCRTFLRCCTGRLKFRGGRHFHAQCADVHELGERVQLLHCQLLIELVVSFFCTYLCLGPAKKRRSPKADLSLVRRSSLNLSSKMLFIHECSGSTCNNDKIYLWSCGHRKSTYIVGLDYLHSCWENRIFKTVSAIKVCIKSY